MSIVLKAIVMMEVKTNCPINDEQINQFDNLRFNYVCMPLGYNI